MRILQPKLEVLGQPVVIENRPGAGGVVGTGYVTKQAPNGDVLVLSTLSPIGLAPGLPAPMPFDPIRDLTPIAPTCFIPTGLAITQSGVSAHAPQELVALMKAAPGRDQYGSSGSAAQATSPRRPSRSRQGRRRCTCPIAAADRSSPPSRPVRSTTAATSPAC
jgi:tripartite-type tricarboxylate transporter receptor subunit TctC